MPPTKTRRAIAYCRVSTTDQAESGASLRAQEKRLRAYCDALEDLDLVAVIRDEGESAKTLRRPGLERALALLESGEADALLVTKLDRATRSVRDLGELLERFFGDGRADLLSLGESVDTGSAAGRLVLNLLVSVSQWEREAIGERTREALAQLRSEGVHMGRAPLGRNYDEETDAQGRRLVVEDDEEAETIARVQELRGEGLSLRAIAGRLAEEGRRTKRGGRWAAETVRLILSRAETAPVAA